MVRELNTQRIPLHGLGSASCFSIVKATDDGSRLVMAIKDPETNTGLQS
jgi:hypothetical protein